MERLMHETRETLTAVMIVACLAAGIGGAVVYTLGSDGWLTSMVRDVLQDPNLATLAALTAVIASVAVAKRILDRDYNSILNNLLVGAVGLGGFVILLQGVRAVLG
jgi:FtsH-binding integral membrane protein